MGREGGLLRFPRFTPSTTPIPSQYASLDGGKEAEPSDSSLSSSLEDWRGKDRKGWLSEVEEEKVSFRELISDMAIFSNSFCPTADKCTFFSTGCQVRKKIKIVHGL